MKQKRNGDVCQQGKIGEKKVKQVLVAGMLAITAVVSVQVMHPMGVNIVQAAEESDEGTVIGSGTCGSEDNEGGASSVTWTVYDTDADLIWDKLVISGTGKMADYDSYTDYAPWSSYTGASGINLEIQPGVTSIGNCAFQGDNLTNITIPDSVTSIGKYAFAGCKLKSITIPNSVTSIGDWAFDFCRSLTAITIPDSVTSIGDGVFRICGDLESIIVQDGNPCYKVDGKCLIEKKSNVLKAVAAADLTSVEIPDGVTRIGDGAFECCSSLTTIKLPDSVTSIGDWAFDSCSSLTAIKLPDSVTSIGDSAFEGCSSLTVITIPGSVESIGEYAFTGCGNLTSVTISDGVTSIGKNMFWSCSSLTGITIPDSVTSIGDHAFMDCSTLADITIPNSVTSIGEYAFDGCSLKNIVIPDSVTSIGKGAFRSCISLASITVQNGNPYYKVDGKCLIEKKSNTLLAVAPVGLTSITIPDGVTSIGDWAFCNCSSLTAITIPDSVTSIGDRAFDSCRSLTCIYGYTGSYAETYAKENGYTFVALDKQVQKFTGTSSYQKETSDKAFSLGVKLTQGDGALTYKSSNTSVATVSSKGMVTIKGAGTTNITVTAAGTENYTATSYTVKLTVKFPTVTNNVSNAAKGVNVKWSKVKGAKGYIVYRMAKGAKNWDRVKTITKSSTVSYVDTKAKSGTVYYYQVKAYSKSGDKIVYSTAKASKAIRYLKAPTEVAITKKQAGIKVTWKKVTGAKGYIVYRKTGSGKWTRVKTIKSAKTVTYLDKTAKKGKKYTYRVKAKSGTTYSAAKTSKTVKR